jgi:hypothetical protein
MLFFATADLRQEEFPREGTMLVLNSWAQCLKFLNWWLIQTTGIKHKIDTNKNEVDRSYRIISSRIFLGACFKPLSVHSV